ncbi:MAG: hypothetical protein IJY72_03570, partial [Akkermansia sp.]|nr:hypothetical protein [Akkermansia sp.]
VAAFFIFDLKPEQVATGYNVLDFGAFELELAAKYVPDESRILLMKAADSRDPAQWGNLAESPAGADGWYVHLLAGDVALARRLACEVPRRRWACFQRGRRSAAPHRLGWQRLISNSRRSGKK